MKYFEKEYFCMVISRLSKIQYNSEESRWPVAIRTIGVNSFYGLLHHFFLYGCSGRLWLKSGSTVLSTHSQTCYGHVCECVERTDRFFFSISV